MFTILTTTRSQDGTHPILTKRFTQGSDGALTKHDYDKAYLFDASEETVADIFELSGMLTVLEDFPHSCVVRAQPTGATSNILRRLSSENGATPPLRDNPRGLPWVMLDFDKLPVADLGLTTTEDRLAYLVAELPAEFHDVTYHYQWSSSAGLDGWKTLSAHLWFFLDRPWACRTLYERFGDRDGDFKNVPVDPAPFTSNQIHYTAAPIFVGVTDPVGKRSGLVRGSRDVVALRPFVRPVVAPPAMSPRQHYDTFGLKRYGELLGEIGPDYHRPILRAVAHYCAVVPQADFDRAFLEESLRDAIQFAPPGKNRKADYLSRSYLNRVIAGGVRKFQGGF